MAVTTTTYSAALSRPRYDVAPWLPAEDPMDYSYDFYFEAMAKPIGFDGLYIEQRDVLSRWAIPGDLNAPASGFPSIMQYKAFADNMRSRFPPEGTYPAYGIWSTTRQAERVVLPVRGSQNIVGFRTYIDVEARLVGFDPDLEPMTLSASIDGELGLIGTTFPRPYLTDQWAIHECPQWQLAASGADAVAASQYDLLALYMATADVRAYVNADVRSEEYLRWGDVELGWVSLRVEVDIGDDEVISYRRTFPRDDGLAGGAPRTFPPSRALQSSNRIGGGYL